jgi:peptidylprolyl isomerase
MSTRTRPALSLLLIAALALVGVAGCGGTTQSQADKAASLATEQQKNPPKITDATTPAVTVKAVKVTPGPGEGDLKTKPVIPKQTGADPKTLIVQDVIVGTGAEAKAGDTVDVQYVGVLRKDGKEFDSSWKRKQPFSFALGSGQVIAGWDSGVVGMKVGGRRRLIIPADQAYGAQGQPPTIPANAALVFDVDLLKVTPAK